MKKQKIDPSNKNSKLIEFLDNPTAPYTNKDVSIDMGNQSLDDYQDDYTDPDWTPPPPIQPTINNTITGTTPTVQPPPGYKVYFSPYASDAARTQFNIDFYATKALMDADGLGHILKEEIDLEVNIQYAAAGLYYFPPQDLVQVCAMRALRNGSYDYVLIHELGHRFQFMCGYMVPSGSTTGLTLNQVVDSMYYHAYSNDHSLFPTEYSKTNTIEFWAESFAYYYLGLLGNIPHMQKWVEECIKEYKIVCRF